MKKKKRKKERKKKKGLATTFFFQITKQPPSQSQTQIGEKKEDNHKTQIGEKKEERQRGKNPHPNPPLPIKPPSKTHTHKPTTANLYKSKPIMPIYCTMTHYDLDPQPTIPLPLDSTHTP